VKDSLKSFIKKYFTSFSYFYQRLRYRIFIRMALSIGVGVLDGFGLAMFLPLLQMTDESSKATSKGLGNLGFLVDGFKAVGLELNLVSILLIMSLFFLLKGGAQYINNLYGVTLRQFFIRTVRVRLSTSLTQMSYKAFVTSDAGRIQNTVSGEVGRISQAYESYFTAFQQVVMIIVYMLFAFFVDAQFAVLICIGGGLTNLIFSSIYRATKAASKRVTTGANSYQNLILQFVSNFKYLKATGFIKEYNKKLVENIIDIEESTRRVGVLGAIVGAVREPVLIIVVSAVIFIQVKLLGGSIGTIMVSLLFFYRALSALLQMQTAYNNFLGVSGSMENMTEFEKELNAAKEKLGTVTIDAFTKEIELKNAVFRYAENSANILDDINLKIIRNQTIAFVGESGSGKTTLVNIIAGLMPVTSGQMTVDGVNAAVLNTDSFQRRIGYITQEPVVFNDTIFNNITLWGDPTPNNKKRFEYALEQASVISFIDNLPAREETMLGNSGINLSGGQKQRISIAREIYKSADILILDEATSALDSETEKAIQKGLEGLHGNYTILIVAHRLSTVKNADWIVVMEKGKIIAEGSFNELIITSPRFKKMVELQEV